MTGREVIEVGTENKDLHLNTWYFINVEWTGGLPASGQILLNQQRSISLLASGIPKKMQFNYDRELVKFAAFALPNQLATLLVEVEGLSAHSYPTIYLKHIEREKPIQDVEDLDYPTLDNYEQVLFDNAFERINKQKVRHSQ